MLSKFFRSLVGGDQNTEPAPSRKRKATVLEEDDIIITSSKRCKQSERSSSSGWQISGRVAEWLVRSKRSFQDSYYVRKLKTHVSPSNFIERISSYKNRRNVPDRESCNTPGFEPRQDFNQGAGSFLEMSQSRQVANPHQNPDGQFKMPAPKPGGDTGLRLRNLRPQYRMEQRSSVPNSGPSPMSNSGPSSMSSSGLPYNGLNASAQQCPTTGGYQPLFDKMYRQSSTLSSASTNVSKNIFRSRLAAKESIRLDERSRYEQLLQQFTSVPLTTHNTTRPRRNTPSTQSRGQTLLGSRISQISQGSRRTPSKDDKPEVIQVTAHSNEKPYIDVTSPGVNIPPRLRDRPNSESTPKSSISANNASGLSVQPKVLIPHGKQNGSIVSQNSGSSLEMLNSPASPEVIVLDSPPPLSPKSFLVEDFERSLKEFKYNEEWLQNLKESYSDQARRRSQHIRAEEVKKQVFNEECEERDRLLESEIRHRLKLSRKVPAAEEYDYVESSSSEEEEELEDEFPEMTDQQEDAVNRALVSRPGQEVLSDGFRLQVRRADMETLKGLNWLNDEVVNFYFELIRERGKLDNFPSVHVFNTFFYPKVKNQGQQGVRRWTKSVDIYSFDYIAIPIHLGMHWCLAIVDFGKKAIRYFDSMGGRNMECLSILKKYLEDEHKQKKGSPYDMSEWTLENVQGLPQQMNGSDCGVFTCKYADYVCRGRQITFSQDNMPYFRRRMVFEILNKALL